jgi:hypothetical protein
MNRGIISISEQRHRVEIRTAAKVNGYQYYCYDVQPAAGEECAGSWVVMVLKGGRKFDHSADSLPQE